MCTEYYAVKHCTSLKTQCFPGIHLQMVLVRINNTRKNTISCSQSSIEATKRRRKRGKNTHTHTQYDSYV